LVNRENLDLKERARELE
jgi:hypothetical protein